jgi:hypothetical protein
MNSFDAIDPKLIDVALPFETGYPDDLARGDTLDALKFAAGTTAREFPESWWIEPKDWADAARDNDKYKTWPINYVDRFTNQNPTHECTCHSLSRAFEGCRNRQRGVSYADGPQKGRRYEESGKFGSVWVSALSVYAEANPGQWGGASIRGVMEIAVRRGFLPDKIQPAAYGFKHDLQGTAGSGNSNQSSGSFVRTSGFPSGWQETAKHFKPLEIIFPDSLEQAVCLVLHGLLVCVGRNGHAVPWAMFNVADRVLPYPDSYDVIRYDSWRTAQSAWRGSFAIATVSAPDDWTKPAGE